MKGWLKERMNCEEFGRSIFEIVQYRYSGTGYNPYE